MKGKSKTYFKMIFLANLNNNDILPDDIISDGSPIQFIEKLDNEENVCIIYLSKGVTKKFLVTRKDKGLAIKGDLIYVYDIGNERTISIKYNNVLAYM